jgi:hypothetical protein
VCMCQCPSLCPHMSMVRVCVTGCCLCLSCLSCVLPALRVRRTRACACAATLCLRVYVVCMRTCVRETDVRGCTGACMRMRRVHAVLA